MRPTLRSASQPTIVFVRIGRNYCIAYCMQRAKTDLAFIFTSWPTVEGKWKRMMMNRISSRLNFTIRRNNNHYREFSLADKFLGGIFFSLPIPLLRIFLSRAAANFIVNLIAVKMILRRRKSHIAFFFTVFFFFSPTLQLFWFDWVPSTRLRLLSWTFLFFLLPQKKVWERNIRRNDNVIRVIARAAKMLHSHCNVCTNENEE